MPRGWILVLAALVAAYVGLCLLAYLLQRSLLYMPTPEPSLPPESVETLAVDGATLRLAVHRRDGARALLYFGGNAQDVSRSLDRYAEWFPDHAIYMVHYRGYGGSTGSPSETALHADALAAFEHVHARHPRTTIVGRSLGSALAVRLAATRPVDRLILITPFDSIVNVVRDAYPFLPLRLLLRDRYESVLDAPRVEAPTLILAASDDTIGRPARTRVLLEAFPDGVARLVRIDDTGHNTISYDPAFADAIRSGYERPAR